MLLMEIVRARSLHFFLQAWKEKMSWMRAPGVKQAAFLGGNDNQLHKPTTQLKVMDTAYKSP